MRRALIEPGLPFWRNAIGVVCAVVLVPLVIILKLLIMPFERPRKLTSAEVAQYIRELLDGTGEDWDWDDFISIEIEDPVLDSIRSRAAQVELPLTQEGILTLEELLAEADALR